MTTVIPPIMKDLIRKGRLGWVDEPFSGHAVLVERGTGCIIRDARNQKITGPKVPFRQTAPLNEQEFLDHARDRDIENDVDWMYQDHKGNVTIGIGHKVATAEDAVVLVAFFEDRDDPATPITDDAIRAAYLAVKQDPHTGKLFGHFETHTALRLKSLASSEIFHKDVDRILGELAAHSEYSPHKFETFPPDAKFAIMDMAFNMGAAGVAHVYSRFTAAVSRRNWALAATESDRPDLSPKRNQVVRTRLENAARLELFFIDPDCRRPKARQ
jgi:GH24 family phage-related lysozyme (muramidase)